MKRKLLLFNLLLTALLFAEGIACVYVVHFVSKLIEYPYPKVPACCMVVLFLYEIIPFIKKTYFS